MKSTFLAEDVACARTSQIGMKTRSKLMAVGNNLAFKGFSPGRKIALELSPWAGDTFVPGDAADKAQGLHQEKSKLA